MSPASSQEKVSIAKKTIKEFSDDRCTQLAAALAYYTIFSLPPLLVLIITICGFFWSAEQVTGTVMTEIKGMVGEQGAQQIQTMLNSAGTQGKGIWATIISILMLIISATAAVAQLQMSLNQIWEIKQDPDRSTVMSRIWKRIFSFGMILGIAFIILVSTVLSTVISSFSTSVSSLIGIQSNAIIYILNMIVELFVFTLLFSAIFKFMPDAKIRWKDVWVGAVVTSVLFILGKFVIGYYLGSMEPTSTYGAAGNLVLILLWVYLSSLILFIGAEFTQVWARRHGHEIVPDDGYLIMQVHLVNPQPLNADRR